MESKKRIFVFWTGGWDSTYRVVELSREKVFIQPIYILDKKRPSNKREMASITKITAVLKKHPETRAIFEPLIVINVQEIPEDGEISAAAKKLATENGLGIQHDWTARVAKQYKGVEMCIEKALPGSGYTPIKATLDKYATLVRTSHGLTIDPEKTDNVVALIFKNIVLPIFEITETDMLNNIKKWGYEDVMKYIWFCHTPINGKPCGLCSPCHTKIDSNMKFLLPEEALMRYKKASAIEKYWGGDIKDIQKVI